jgi:outer membrane immunogenic protein
MFAGLLTAGAVQAADMPLKAPPQLAQDYYNWSGFYIGIHGGGGVVSDFHATLWDDGDEPLRANKRTFGLFGVHGGYNWQMGQGLVGIEGDYSWANARSTVSNDEPDSTSVKLQSLASVRGRVGAVFGNMLVYGTAGWGWARTKYNFNDSVRATRQILINVRILKI